MELICPNCGSDKATKSGIVKGRQRYKCKDCSYHFTVSKLGKKIDDYYVTKALQLYLEGLSYREIERILGVSHALRCEVSAILPLTYADADRIAQVLHNLIGNALKFADPDSGEVLVTAYQLNQDLKVNIQDNGPGIPEEDRDLVFDKFYQVRNQTRRKPSGSGLGLAICKNIIQMHKGRIWVSESADRGTKISFTLPLYTNESQLIAKENSPHEQ